MKYKIIVLFVTLMIVYMFCGAVSAATSKTNTLNPKITGGDSFNDFSPTVNGRYILWTRNDFDLNQNLIYYRDIKQGKTKILSNNGVNPEISGNRVVWVHNKHISNLDFTSIFYKNLANGYFNRVHFSYQNQLEPSISGTRVVWIQKQRNGNWSIYYKNLAVGKTIKVNPSTHNQYHPDISGTKIVWTQDDSPNHPVIYLKNLATGYCGKLFKSNYKQGNVCISGNKVVWQQKDSTGKWSVYYKNLFTKITGKISNSINNQSNPKISGNQVVWLETYDDDVNYVKHTSIHYTNLKTNQNIILASEKLLYDAEIEGKSLLEPDIYNFRVVWTVDESGYGMDYMMVYYYNLVTKKMICLSRIS